MSWWKENIFNDERRTTNLVLFYYDQELTSFAYGSEKLKIGIAMLNTVMLVYSVDVKDILAKLT